MNILERLDADQQWSQEETMLIDSVRQLATEVIAPMAAHYDKTSEFPWENIQKINELGLNAMFIPEEYSGSPMSYASYLAMRMATDSVQFHGGYGYCKDYRVERLMRDAKITQIWEGTNQIHRQLIGRSFLKKEKR